MPHRTLAALSLILPLLGGCSHDPVRNIGDGAHAVTACSQGGITNPQVDAMHAADKYCGKSGQVAAIENFKPGGTCGTPPTASVTAEFFCR